MVVIVLMKMRNDINVTICLRHAARNAGIAVWDKITAHMSRA
jgi:hypothetical protein